MQSIPNILKINYTLVLIFSVLVMLLSIENSNASVYGVLKGRVLDADGKPAIGASVRVMGTTRGARVKVDGEFTIVNILAGNYKVKITKQNYQNFYKDITIVADSTNEIETINLSLSYEGYLDTLENIYLDTLKKNYNPVMLSTAKYGISTMVRFGEPICLPSYNDINLNSNEKENGIYKVYTQIIKDYIKNRVSQVDFSRIFSFLKYEITTRKIDKNSTESKYTYFDILNTSILTIEDNTIRQLFPINSTNQRYDAFSLIFYPNNNYYYLVVNDIQRYNPPTAKFGILENLSLNAGVVLNN